jgi:uncharacterized protein YcbK (DUF882 family)
MLERILANHFSEHSSNPKLCRRRFIRNFACGALLTLGSPALAQPSKSRLQLPKSLAFLNPHTGDKLKLTYFERGRFIKSALREINFVLRDYRTGDVHMIDTDLLDQLHDLKLMLGMANRPFHIVSGYRSPYTNTRLHYENSGVANNSLHMQGRAIDIRIEGVHTRHIRNAAFALRRGGIGYYPESDFVHLDTGKFRTW